MGGDQLKRPTIRVRSMKVKKKLSPKQGKEARKREEEPQEEATIQPRVVHAKE
jgi:hypothetical protein